MFRRTLTRHGVELTRTGTYLSVRTLEHHAGPAHLSHASLAKLGLRVTIPVAGLPTSAVLHCAGHGAFCELHSPDVLATAERGRFAIGDLLFVAVKEGLDLFVWDHHAEPLLLPIASWPGVELVSVQEEHDDGGASGAGCASAHP